MQVNKKNRKLYLFSIVSFLTCSSILGIKNFVLISAPGSGKGTFSQYMVEKYDYLQICPGDLLRNEIALETDLGKHIKPIVERGDYVQEDIVCKLIEKYFNQACSENKGFIIDGFPRSITSFNFLNSLLKKKKLEKQVCFLQFEASDDVCLKRILGRLICMSCFKVYNKFSKPPKQNDFCDLCSSKLSFRSADKKDIVQKRLEYFHNNVEPLINMAQGCYETKKMSSEISFDTLEIRYEELLEK